MGRRRERVAFIALVNVILIMTSSASNHWVLKEGKIKPQFDSPFYMKRPHDLVAFMNQSHNQDTIDGIHSELQLIRSDIKEQLSEVENYALAYLQETKCMMQYFLEESDLHISIGNRKYMDHLYRDGASVLEMQVSEGTAGQEPICTDYLNVDFSLFCFEHLRSMANRHELVMSPEDPLKLNELGIVHEQFASMLVSGMRAHPQSWQYYTLASYYWRLHGDAPKAVQCSRSALLLAPRPHKDIALLSLGTILQRCRQHEDAVVVLSAAADHNAMRAENFFALGHSLFFLNEFNRSMDAYDSARALNDVYRARVDFIENSLICFKFAKTKLNHFDGIVAQINQRLRTYEEKRSVMEEHVKRMVQQQVPLGEREYFKQPDGNLDVTNENLAELVQQRGQYCARRISAETNAPELFCDFVHDMKSEADEIKIDMISKYLEQTTEVMRTTQGSLGAYALVDIDRLEGERFVTDTFGDVPGVGTVKTDGGERRGAKGNKDQI